MLVWRTGTWYQLMTLFNRRELVNSLHTLAQLSKQTLWLKAVMVPIFTSKCFCDFETSTQCG